MKAPTLLELQRMNKNEKSALFAELTNLGMFYGVEKGNTKGKQSVCKGCNMVMAKGGNLRFRHLVCTPRCYAPKITNDTCGRWHPECLVAMQASNPERFVLTNPEFKPIKASWQLAGFEDLSQEEQELILRVLDGKTGVVTKRRLTASGLSRKLSFTGSNTSENLAADPVPAVVEETKISVSDRVLPKIILRSPSKLNNVVKKENPVKSPVKHAGKDINLAVMSAATTGKIESTTSQPPPQANGSKASSHIVPAETTVKSEVPTTKSPVRAINSPSKPTANGVALEPAPVSATPISPGTNLAANLLTLKSPKKDPVQAVPKSPVKSPQSTVKPLDPQAPVDKPKSPTKSENPGQAGLKMLSESIQLQSHHADESIPASKRALESPGIELLEKKPKYN